MAKRFKLNIGDIFTIPLENGEFAIGQIICFPKTSDGFIIVIFDNKTKTFDIIENVKDYNIIFLGYTFDAKLYYKDWKIIGNSILDIQKILLPYYKLGTKDDARLVNYKSETLKKITENQFDQLTYKSEIAPIRYENAINAYFGFREWIAEDYDKLLYKKTLESVKIAEEILNGDDVK